MKSNNMKTPHDIYLESVDTFEKITPPVSFEWCDGHRTGVINLIKSHTIRMLEADIKRLEEVKKPVIENMLLDDPLFQERGMDGVKGYNQALQDQIDHYKSELTKIQGV